MRKLFVSAVLALAAIGGCSKDKTADSESADHLRTMTLDEVENGIAANQLTAIDCNGERTRKKLGILPGAVVISDEETYPATELPADKARRLVFYCSDTA